MSDVITQSTKTTTVTAVSVQLSSSRATASAANPSTQTNDGGKADKPFEDGSQDSVAQRIKEGLEQAREKADALEKSLKEGKAALDQGYLENLDKLLDTYLLIAAFSAARGDGAGVKRIAEQAARLAGDTPERLQRIGEVELENAKSGGQPVSEDFRVKISLSISVKLQALSYQADAAPRGEAAKEAAELRELAYATSKAGETDTLQVTPDTVGDLLRKAAESVGISREDLTAKLSVQQTTTQTTTAVFVSEQV